MRRLRNSLTKFFTRAGTREGARGDEVDAKEIKRLNAEYTGSFARNAGQELGILPPRYDRK